MLVFGVGLPFNHFMYRPVEEWPDLHAWIRGNAPQAPERAAETAAVLEGQAKRIAAAAANIRDQLNLARPDALVILATDHGRMFSDVQIPQISTIMAAEIWGSTRLAELGEPAEDDIVRFPGGVQLANFIQEELVRCGFDMSRSEFVRALAQPAYGVDASLVLAARSLSPGRDVPVVPIFVNTHREPAITGARCQAFGRALGAILDERPERIGLVASGGLSHDHHGSRAGFVDDRLDGWVLETLSRGRSERLAPVFAVQSDSAGGGTAEIRLWMMLGAACESLGAEARTVDYVQSFTAATGMGFATWAVEAAIVDSSDAGLSAGRG